MQPSLGLAALMALVAAPAFGQDTAPDLRDLVGARAGQAEGELERRGYRDVRGEKGDDRSYTYWWNADRRRCVTIATMDGRYASITSTPAPDCRQYSSEDRVRPSRRDGPRGGAGSYAGAGPGDLPRLCRGKAAAAFDLRPGEITANAPIRQRGGFLVQGWFEGRERTKFFTCRFDRDGRFLMVN